METILALILMSPMSTITIPSYSVNHCYEKDSEAIVEITYVGKVGYVYNHYVKISESEYVVTVDLNGSFNTIETVYTEEVNCP